MSHSHWFVCFRRSSSPDHGLSSGRNDLSYLPEFESGHVSPHPAEVIALSRTDLKVFGVIPAGVLTDVKRNGQEARLVVGSSNQDGSEWVATNLVPTAGSAIPRNPRVHRALFAACQSQGLTGRTSFGSTQGLYPSTFAASRVWATMSHSRKRLAMPDLGSCPVCGRSIPESAAVDRLCAVCRMTIERSTTHFAVEGTTGLHFLCSPGCVRTFTILAPRSQRPRANRLAGEP